MKKILILGVNGFIGHHLTRRILETTDWQLIGMDIAAERIQPWIGHPRFDFHQGDIRAETAWVAQQVERADVVLPLVAIATPATYVSHPLRVFELDFEANLPIIRLCVEHDRHLVFPSTSEVYGMCRDREFDAETSELVYGPIGKPRWIYAASKQLLDRVIHAYGMERQLRYTLFRPFNWIGPGQDDLHAAKAGSSRVMTQFLGHIVRGEPLTLVDGGRQKRSFTFIDDGIDALMRIIENRDDRALGKIYNIGNPANHLSIRELAESMLSIAAGYPEFRDGAARVTVTETRSADYYGSGYQDVPDRVPKITNTCAELDWQPHITMDEAIRKLFDQYRDALAR